MMTLIIQFKADATVSKSSLQINENSLIKQLYAYENALNRTEMYDRDVVFLQLCVTLFDSPDSFLLACLHRFNLLDWAKKDFDSPRLLEDREKLCQTNLMAEEFLRLIIILSQERYTPGIGQVY